MIIALTYTHKWQRCVTFEDTEALMQRLRWLRGRRIAAVAYQDGIEVGRVEQIGDRWVCWFQPELFAESESRV